MNNTLPRLPLNEAEKLWLTEVYNRNLNGVRFTHKQIWSVLHGKIPSDFRPASMDPRLIDSGGQRIMLLGVYALTGEIEIFTQVDNVIYAIKEIWLKNPEISEIKVSEITDKTGLEGNLVSLIINLIAEFGDFSRGGTMVGNSFIFQSIKVEGSDQVYYNYLRFPGIKPLVLSKPFESYTPKGDTFSFGEQIEYAQKIDLLVEKVNRIELGQELLYTDLTEELNEMKGLFFLTKKNWMQILHGKIFEMFVGGIISETASKELVEYLKSFNAKLLI